VARVDEPPEERDSHPLLLDALVDCTYCGLSFDVVFEAPEGVYEREDLVDQPEMDVTCPACGTIFHATYTGWTEHEDA